MNKTIKKKWIDALQSGEYNQTCNGVLKEGDSYCCLGVLCDIHRREHSNLDWKKVPFVKSTLDGKEYQYLNESELLPQEVRLWAGLNNTNPTCVPKCKNYSEMNDSGYSFNKIAKFIEKYE